MLTPYECSEYFIGDTKWIKLPTDKYDTQLFIEKKGDEVIVVFKESDSNLDWRSNFHFWKKAYKDCDIPFTAHSGFLRCWKEVRRYIEEEVQKLEPGCITVTGWSYGGALAVLCSEDMKYLFPDIKVNLITFGAPRVIGWLNWRKIKNRWEGARQFRNGGDLVTCVPFFLWFFHHVVRRTNIGDKPNIFRFFNPEYHWIVKYRETFEKIIK